MSTDQNKEIALSLIEALNAHDLTLWSRHLSDDYAAEHPGVSVTLDKTRSIAYHQRFVTAFPDIRFEVLGVVSEGDRVLVQWTASGTHEERHQKPAKTYSAAQYCNHFRVSCHARAYIHR